LRKCTFSTFGARVEIVFKGLYIVSSKSCCPRPLPGLWNLLTPLKSLQQINFGLCSKESKAFHHLEQFLLAKVEKVHLRKGGEG
jgi:hypothetical protein